MNPALLIWKSYAGLAVLSAPYVILPLIRVIKLAGDWFARIVAAKPQQPDVRSSIKRALL